MIHINGLMVDDRNHPEDYQGLYFFTDPDDTHLHDEDIKPFKEIPHPYRKCHKLMVCGLSTTSSLHPLLSRNADIVNGTGVTIEQE